MRSERGKIDGDWSVNDDVELHGMVTGAITVDDGGFIRLYGMCCGDFIVHAGGRAAVHGMVKGDVINRGGDVVIYGMVDGVVHEDSGKTTIDATAIIHSRAVRAEIRAENASSPDGTGAGSPTRPIE